MKTYIFKTHLFRDKKISRDIEIKENASLYKLAEAIIGAYDFDFDHAFGFFSDIKEYCFDSKKKYELFADMGDEGIEPTGAESVEKTKVGEVWKNIGDKMMLLFDYGDNWLFVVELSDFGATESKTKYPHVIKKVGKSPEQYPEDEE